MATERLTMSVEEAGERLGISRSLAYELVREGKSRACGWAGVWSFR